MATWGLKRDVVRDRNGWFWMMWPPNYNPGRSYRPVAGDKLKVWSDGTLFAGEIAETHRFLYSSHGEVKLALGGIREDDVLYMKDKPQSGWCVAVRAELVETEWEECPIPPQPSWKMLSD